MAKTKREILDYKNAWAMQKYYEDHEESKEKAKLYQRKRLGWTTKPKHPRTLARLEGKTRYFTGKGCANGHIAERLVSNGRCIDCMYEWRNKYWDENPDRYYEEMAIARARARVMSDPRQKLMQSLRGRVYRAVKREYRTGPAIEMIGCTIEFFKKYIEDLWQPGMSWDNWSPTGWHLDHIKPLYSFDLTDPQQIAEAFHYSNHQPLWHWTI